MKLKVPVEEFTTPDPITAGEHCTVEELGQIMKKHGIRHIPITKSNKVIGIVSERDLRLVAILTQLDKQALRASDIMATDPFTVKSSDTLDQVAYEMSKRKIGSVIVNDQSGKFLGIFTVTDALNALIEITREDS